MPTKVEIDDLIRSKRRTIALEITEDARLVVRAPCLVPRAMIDHFLREKHHWVQKKKAEMMERLQSKTMRTYGNDDEFLLFGEQIPLTIDYASNGKLLLDNGRFILSARELGNPEKAFETWYRETAREYLMERTVNFARTHGFRFAKFRLSSAKKRWGSCSSKGTISLSWRLIMAPPHVIDYVIVHELAHLKHFNHSSRFWSLVESILPNYSAARKWLKQEGHALCL